MTGIYCIENTVNGKKYIGKAVDIFSRWRVHKHHLKNNTHINIHLQNAWNKYGGDSFKFYILEECEKDDLSISEIEWIKRLDTFKHGYNRTEGGEGQTGRYLTDEQKKHLSKINMGALNPNYGLKRSEETRKKLSESLRHPRKPLSEEHKKHISESCKNVDHSSQCKKVMWLENNTVYESITEASKQTGYAIDGISKVCRGARKALYGQHFEYV